MSQYQFLVAFLSHDSPNLFFFSFFLEGDVLVLEFSLGEAE